MRGSCLCPALVPLSPLAEAIDPLKNKSDGSTLPIVVNCIGEDHDPKKKSDDIKVCRENCWDQ
jgi:hypothetical protein